MNNQNNQDGQDDPHSNQTPPTNQAGHDQPAYSQPEHTLTHNPNQTIEDRNHNSNQQNTFQQNQSNFGQSSHPNTDHRPQPYPENRQSPHDYKQPDSPPHYQDKPKRSPVKPSADTVRKAQDFIIFIYMSIGALLIFRFVLSLLGANQQSTFVSFIYDVTYPPLLPFDSMFGRDLYRPIGYAFEFEVLIALAVYGVIFYGLSRLVEILFD